MHSIDRPPPDDSRPYRAISIYARTLARNATQIDVLSFRPGSRRAFIMAVDQWIFH
jgi:hypothetical protein